MARCSFVNAEGVQCKRIVSDDVSYCYSHDPAMSDYRSSIAKKAGKAGGRGRPKVLGDELTGVKAAIDDVVRELRAGEIERGTAIAVTQTFNVKLRAIEAERRLFETTTLQDEIETLRSIVEAGDSARAELEYGHG